ncbi:S-adenosyl-L-methionine-dependent methyltransferase [Apiospora saccharicola]
MAPLATNDGKSLAENLQDQFRSVPVTADNGDAKLAMIHAMGFPGEKLLQQAGLLLPDDDAPKHEDKNTKKEEPFALFDNACGTGLIAGLLQKRVLPAVLRESRFVCADLNANLVDIVKWRAERDGWQGTVETAVADAQSSANSNPLLVEAYRLLRPNGTLAFTVWAADNTGWIPDMRSAFAALPFAAAAGTPLMPGRVPMAVHGLDQWVDPAGIRAELVSSSSVGFEDMRIETLEHTSRIDSAEYFVEAFDMMRKWMMQSYWPEEARQAAAEDGGAVMYKVMVEHLQERYGGNGWDIRWKSILVTCRKPS